MAKEQQFAHQPPPSPEEIAERVRALRKEKKLPNTDELANDPELMEHWWKPIEWEEES